MKTVAIIPARGGSKGIPRKNIVPFNGRPMIEWTIEAALASEIFDAVYVSTEDIEIEALSASAGARIHRRPLALADDDATLLEVLVRVIDDLGEERFDACCLLLPNCPLREAQDIKGSFDYFRLHQAPALISVVKFGWTPPFRALTQGVAGLEGLFGDYHLQKRQTWPECVCPSGAIYWSTPAVISSAKSLYVDGISGFEMPWHRAIDIDEWNDLELAECIANSIKHGFTFHHA